MTGRRQLERPLRLGLDAHTVGRRQTGNERYVVELGNALAARSDVAVIAYVDKGIAWPARRGRTPRLQPLSMRASQLRIPFELPVRARRDRVDLLQVNYVAPPVAGVPVVTVVHDLSFEDVPGLLPRAMRLRLQATVRLAVWKSAAVVAVSEFTRRRLVEAYGIDPARVHAVPNGVSARWRPLDEDVALARLLPLELEQQFVLFVGAAGPRKNLDRVVEAVARLRREGIADLGLVIAGPPIPARSKAWTIVESYVGEGWIRHLGYVDDDDLHALYCAARAVVYPSLYEGFGLPVIEALACGAVVVASSTTAIPEVAGEAAVLVDPADIGAIAVGLSRALTDETLRARLRAAGPQRAALFSWARAAQRMMGVYHAVVAAHGP